jgi:hypothetical protein
MRRLTFDVRGGHKWAKPACGRPLDGGVRPHRGDPTPAIELAPFIEAKVRIDYCGAGSPWGR